MKQIGFKNFRKFVDFPVMDLAPITILVGGNNAGKSTLTKALMLVFDNLRNLRIDPSKNIFSALTPKFQWSNTGSYNLHIGNYKRAHNRKSDSTSMKFDFTIEDYTFEVYINEGQNEEENSSPINKIVVSCSSKQMEFVFDYMYSQMQLSIRQISESTSNSENIESIEDNIAKLEYLIEDLSSEDKSSTDYIVKFQSLSEEGGAIFDILKDIQRALYAIKNNITDGNKQYEISTDDIESFQKSLESANREYQELYKVFQGDKGGTPFLNDNFKILSRTAAIELLFDRNKDILTALKKLKRNSDKLTGTATIPFSDFSDTEGSLTVSNLIMDMVKYAQKSPKVDEKTKNGFPNLQESIQLILSFSPEIKAVAEGVERVLNNSVLEYIPAHAASQQILFNPENRDFMSCVIDDYFERRIQPGDEEHDFILYWLKEFEIGTNFQVDSIDGFYKVNIVNDESSDEGVPLADMGMGSIQLAILLLRLATIISRYKGRTTLKPTIIVEEPEMNLHPKAQSKLANLFAILNEKYGFQFIIETHSEYLVRKTQLIVADDFAKGQSNPFKTYYFTGNEDVYKDMDYQPSGLFREKFGSGFFDEAGRLHMAILKKAREERR